MNIGNIIGSIADVSSERPGSQQGLNSALSGGKSETDQRSSPSGKRGTETLPHDGSVRSCQGLSACFLFPLASTSAYCEQAAVPNISHVSVWPFISLEPTPGSGVAGPWG